VSDWLMKTIRGEARRLLELAAGDAELRADLQALAEEILASLSAAEPASAGTPASCESTERLRELTLGQPRSSQRQSPIDRGFPPKPSRSPDNISFLEAQCRKKAEAARWAAECQRRLSEGSAPSKSSDAVTSDQELAGWVERLTDALYWMSAKAGEDRKSTRLNSSHRL